MNRLQTILKPEGGFTLQSLSDFRKALILDAWIGPGETRLYQSDNHYKNFVDCVISREPTAAPVDVAHRSITPSHLGNIAMTLGRKLKWDPEKEEFLNDAEANALRTRPASTEWMNA